MQGKRNYQIELDRTLEEIRRGGDVPTLLLHACCAPCSSYVLEYLSRYFAIRLLFYDPNIFPPDEYHRRAEELERLIEEMPMQNPVELLPARDEPREFYDAVRGLEHIPEGGERCFACFRLRLAEAARTAAALGADYFTTTLTISPLKNADKLNEIGEQTAAEYGVRFLPSDFKKRDGYKRSTELSREYGLYRQDYCGCEFSWRERTEVSKKEKRF